MNSSTFRLGRGRMTPEGETYFRAQYVSAGERVAELNAHDVFGDDTLHLDDLFVEPSHQRNHLASYLVKGTLATVEMAGLQYDCFDAGTTNFRIIRLMEKLGGDITYTTDDDRRVSSDKAIAYLLEKVEMPILEALRAHLPEPDPSG